MAVRPRQGRLGRASAPLVPAAIQARWSCSLMAIPTARSATPWAAAARCEDSIGCMHGSSEPDLRNWKSPPPQFTQGARPDEHP
ncbi:hypothetical protein CXD77_10900 [Bordetella pertussis]|nr:hypothetical protein CXD77_10900 [Bordetella pertussis]